MNYGSTPNWESLLKHGICEECGATLDFDDICTDCTGGSDYVDNVLGT
jgi:predicted amidophosphoribosyltransferase